MRNGFVCVVLGIGTVTSIAHAEKGPWRHRPASLEAVDAATVSAWTEKWEAEIRQNEQAWQSWRDDFRAALDSSAEYAAATDAVKAYRPGVFSDKDELANLEAARDAISHDIALSVYENHFGAWQGGPDEFDLLVSIASDDPFERCATQAIRVCGAGKVLHVHVSGDSCEFTCGTPAAQSQ